MQIDVALERRLDLFDLNAACCCVVNHRGRQAGRESMQQVLNRIGRRVVTQQNRRFVCMKNERLLSS